MGVYAFLSFPAWVIPFPKPRFAVQGDRLEALNVPLPSPRSIFEAESVFDLPFVEYDIAFDPDDWRSGFLDRAYAVRFLLSRFPRWSPTRPIVSMDALGAVNGELLRSFLDSVREHGSTPLVVFFPAMSDLIGEGTGRMGIAQRVLRSKGIPYLDMTDCVQRVPPADRFVILHYSPETNAAIAGCLVGVIRERLSGP